MQKRIQNFAYLVKTTTLFKNALKLIRSTDSVVLSSDRALLEYSRRLEKFLVLPLDKIIKQICKENQTIYFIVDQWQNSFTKTNVPERY